MRLPVNFQSSQKYGLKVYQPLVSLEVVPPQVVTSILGRGRELLRFLGGGSVVLPHVMPFNLVVNKNELAVDPLWLYPPK